MHAPPSTVSPLPRGIRLGILLATLFLLLCYAIDHIWATSSDFAHHYSLVARLSQQWNLPAIAHDPSLGEMNFYPRLSHQLAALLGTVLHSPFLGMHVLALLSMMAIWAALGALLLSMPKRAGLPALLIVLAMLSLNFGKLRLDLFGIENVGNFFFAQLLGQAVMAGVLVLALRLERAGQAPLLRYALLIAGIYVVAGIHLLPAAQLVAITLGTIALDSLRLEARSLSQRLRLALPGLLAMPVAVAALALHPAFAAMREISKNDGDLFPRIFSTPALIAAYCVVILAMSAWLLLRWHRLERGTARSHYLALKYIGLFGLAVSALCLLQFLLLQAGQGSAYAVKKYIYGLNSVFVLELALLPLLLRTRLRTAAPGDGNSGLFYSTLALPLLTIVAFRALTSTPPYLDASDVATLEHQLELRRDVSLPAQPGKHVYVMDVPGMPSGISYMMTIGVFGTPRSDNAMNVLSNQPLSEPHLIGTIISGSKSSYGQMSKCLLPNSNSQLALLDGECADRTLHAGRQRVGFTVADGQPTCTLSGFGEAEGGGRWSNATAATIQCPVPQIDEHPAQQLTLSGSPFLHGTRAQRLTLRVDAGPEQEFRFQPGQPEPKVQIALPPNHNGRVTLHLQLPDAISPQQLGLSADTRQLGWMIQSLEFN
ncbi:MAG: hypothetical protein ACEQSK_07140 [Sphingomonadaceae bacterium]